jgi:hypothetical protein
MKTISLNNNIGINSMTAGRLFIMSRMSRRPLRVAVGRPPSSRTYINGNIASNRHDDHEEKEEAQ